MPDEPAHEKADELRDYFAARPDVHLAYLFGSRASGEASPGSDYDFGVLLEEGTDPWCRHGMAHELGVILDHPGVDVVVLNKAPIELAFNVIATGRRVYERDVATRVDYEAKTMSLYGDYLPVLRQQRKDIIREARVES
ncbi:MAG: nucleotidyltransferase domain-containing protein [Candidatus Brocadiia bacterium]